MCIAWLEQTIVHAVHSESSIINSYIEDSAHTHLHPQHTVHALFVLPVHGHVVVLVQVDVLSCLLQLLLPLLLILLLQVSPSATRKTGTQQK